MNLFNTDVPPVGLKYTNSHQRLLGVYYLIQILILSFWRVCTHRQLLVKWFTERSLRAELRDVKKLHTRTVLLQSESNWITFQKPLHSYLTYDTIIWFLDALIEKNQCIFAEWVSWYKNSLIYLRYCYHLSFSCLISMNYNRFFFGSNSISPFLEYSSIYLRYRYHLSFSCLIFMNYIWFFFGFNSISPFLDLLCCTFQLNTKWALHWKWSIFFVNSNREQLESGILLCFEINESKKIDTFYFVIAVPSWYLTAWKTDTLDLTLVRQN